MGPAYRTTELTAEPPVNQRGAVRTRNGATSRIPTIVTTMAERIVRAVQPQQVILFGSQARGDAHRWSDVDFLVVINDVKDRDRAWDKARDALLGSEIPYDVAVSTAGEIRRYGDLVGMIYRSALREGKVLYDAGAPTQWDRSGRPVILEVDQVSDADRLAQTRRWLQQARGELGTAELVAQTPDQDPSPACYLAQQAAEKALRAVPVFLQVQYPLTHDLMPSAATSLRGGAFARSSGTSRSCPTGHSKARYPGGWRWPTRRDAAEGTRLARAIYETVLRDLNAHGFRQGKSR
jgi:uncharacterized protein